MLILLLKLARGKQLRFPFFSHSFSHFPFSQDIILPRVGELTLSIYMISSYYSKLILIHLQGTLRRSRIQPRCRHRQRLRRDMHSRCAGHGARSLALQMAGRAFGKGLVSAALNSTIHEPSQEGWISLILIWRQFLNSKDHCPAPYATPTPEKGHRHRNNHWRHDYLLRTHFHANPHLNPPPSHPLFQIRSQAYFYFQTIPSPYSPHQKTGTARPLRMVRWHCTLTVPTFHAIFGNGFQGCRNTRHRPPTIRTSYVRANVGKVMRSVSSLDVRLSHGISADLDQRTWEVMGEREKTV